MSIGNSPHFFQQKKSEETADQALPLGMKHSEKQKIDPHQTATYKSTQTNNPTPNGDHSGDIGADIDF